LLQDAPFRLNTKRYRQTDRQTTCCSKGATDSTVGQKCRYFAHFSGASGAISTRVLQDHSFPIFPTPLPSFVQIRPLFEQLDISENVFQTHYNIGVKPDDSNSFVCLTTRQTTSAAPIDDLTVASCAPFTFRKSHKTASPNSKAFRSTAIQLLVLQLHCSCADLCNTTLQYNLQKTCRLLAAVVKKLVLRLFGLLQYNKIFVLCYCSCIVVVLHLCGPLNRVGRFTVKCTMRVNVWNSTGGQREDFSAPSRVSFRKYKTRSGLRATMSES